MLRIITYQEEIKRKFEIYQILNDEKINLKSLNGPTLKDGI